jgi:hypothetical protein
LKGLSFSCDVQPFEVVKLRSQKAIKTDGNESVYESYKTSGLAIYALCDSLLVVKGKRRKIPRCDDNRVCEMKNGKRMRNEDMDTSAYVTACVTVYMGAKVTAYVSANEVRLYKAEQQPSHASRVIAVAGEASPIEVREVSSSRKSNN